MVEVQLFNSDMLYVTTIAIPAFKKMPDVVQWGVRTFKYNHTPDPAFCYVEVFSYTIPGE